MQDTSLSAWPCLKRACKAVTANPGPAIVGGFAWIVIWFGVTRLFSFFEWGIENILFHAFVLPPLAGGIAVLTLNLLKDDRAHMDDILRGLPKYWQFAKVSWLLSAMLLLSNTALQRVVLSLHLSSTVHDEIAPTMLVFLLIFVCVESAIMTRLGFALFVVAENHHGNSALTAFKKSLALSKGHWWDGFFILFVAHLVAGAGAFVCIVGIFLTVPVGWCMFGALYEQLKQRAAESRSVAATLERP